MSEILHGEKRYYTLADLSQPIDYAALFGRGGETEIEIGSGRGDFLLGYSAARPDLNLLGIERNLAVLRRAIHKLRWMKATNVVLLQADVTYLFENYVPAGSVGAIHVYFPDPWPKRRHARRRVFQTETPALLARVLKPGGCLHVRSDVPAYFQVICELVAASGLFDRIEPPADIVCHPTAYERRFVSHGVPVHRASYRLRRSA